MTSAAEIKHLQDHGLYSQANEHDACGVGFVAHIRGEKSHAIAGDKVFTIHEAIFARFRRGRNFESK